MNRTKCFRASWTISWIGLFEIGLLAGLPARPASGLTPDNPRVQTAVKKALKYLEGTNDGRLGARALVGLTFAKSGADEKHPKVAEALRAIQAALKNGSEKFNADIYSTGISIMFLIALDPSRYRYEVESLVESLERRQKTHGAWGYPLTHPTNGDTCDTSMTQYAVLGLWEAEDQAGVEIPRLVWDRVARWLILTQDPSGGFGYQGKPAARLGRTVKQSGVKHSMTVAALGSLYIVKDRVGISKLKKRADDDTPDAFQPYESPEERAARIKTRIDLRHFARALASGNRWVEDNYDVDKLTNFVHYSLYALERYESLREAETTGRDEPLEKTDKSKWYNRGARFLLRTQNEDGSWESKAGLVPDTCFSALFLMGSTRKTLATASVSRYATSSLVGGRGIPAAKEFRLRDGQVVVNPLDEPFGDVLKILADAADPRFARAVESLADAADHGQMEMLEAHAAALTEQALHGRRDVRLLAIRCLSRAKNLEHAACLILLLRDPDPEVAYEAAKALGELSRKFSTLGIGPHSTNQQREEAAAKWTAWYRAIRPDIDLDAFQRKVDSR